MGLIFDHETQIDSDDISWSQIGMTKNGTTPFAWFSLKLNIHNRDRRAQMWSFLTFQIVNGLVLASDGQKMSKRKKNYPDPLVVVNSYGADALRLYLINSPGASLYLYWTGHEYKYNSKPSGVYQYSELIIVETKAIYQTRIVE